MHYCICDKISKMIDVDTNRFMVGGVAADIPQLLGKIKVKSHFIKANDYGLRYDYYSFLNKYKDKLDDAFFKGYFCHLVSDEVWYRTMVNKYVNPLTCDEETRKKYYLDFSKLNEMLIKYFKPEERIHLINDVKMDEIDTGAISKMIDKVYDDFKYNDDLSEKPLDIFKFSDVVNYVNESAEISYKKLKSVLEFTK